MESTMEELRRIRDELNERYMTLTPEERKKELDEAVALYEAIAGHKIKRIGDEAQQAA